MSTLQHELQMVWDAHVAGYKAGDAAGCAAVFTLNGEVHSPYGPPAIGRAVIEALHVEWVKLGGDHKTLVVEACGGSGDLAWALSRYSEGEETGNGTNLSVFERQADGEWLVRVCSLNSSD